ncbi:pyridoxamine 5'-phosphate oxidase family protein [Streptosporangium roseum]|uniref:pyridoxamine 5'-phosphate oxidase family protein n=1 Tax=Streptosporangium roseum TaxID=2001 RepID=UPI00332465A6
MTSRFAQLAFTEDVQRHQREHGSDRAYRRMLEASAGADVLGEAERAFIEQRESFYLASVGQTGWPYIQHRGGPPGFLQAVDERTIGFADFRGNRQYITVGNLDHDDRVALFLMDYAYQARLKILGRARVVEGDSPLAVAGYRATTERTVLIEIEAYDWNCHQHIPQLFPRETVENALTSMQERIDRLERELRDRPPYGMDLDTTHHRPAERFDGEGNLMDEATPLQVLKEKAR